MSRQPAVTLWPVDSGHFPACQDIDALSSPRRTVLDAVLAGAAWAAESGRGARRATGRATHVSRDCAGAA